MKIAVIGCGAMGALYGGYLSRNNDVTLVERDPDRIAKIRADGLRIAEPDGSAAVYRPGITGDTSGMAPVDLVILFVKSMQSEAALEANRALIGRDTYLMTLQNGSGHEEVLRRFTDDAHIVIGTTQHNSAVIGNGEIRHGGSGWTHIGPLVGDAARLEPIREAFASCGFETDCKQDIKRLIWQKMLTNVSASVLTGVLQVPMGFIAENPSAWAICETLVREAVAVAAGEGIEFDADEKVAEVRKVCTDSPAGLTSIYADLRDGRRTEVDTISGSVIRASERNGVPAPTHRAMVQLVHAMEQKNQA